MRWADKLLLLLRSLFRHGSVEHQLDAELRFHLEQQIEENLAAGMSAEEARYAARRSIGGLAQIQEQLDGLNDSPPGRDALMPNQSPADMTIVLGFKNREL